MSETPNLVAEIPPGDIVSWLIGWRDRETGERGNQIVRACHVEEAVRGFETENPTRRVLNVYQSPID
jgi:hypothetical protein